MRPPSWREARGRALGEAGVIENQFRVGTLLIELEFYDGINPRQPILFPPGLNDALIGNQFDVAAGYYTSKDSERTAHVAANLC